MLVKELIETLQELNPEARVNITIFTGNSFIEDYTLDEVVDDGDIVDLFGFPQ